MDPSSEDVTGGMEGVGDEELLQESSEPTPTPSPPQVRAITQSHAS